MKAFPGGRVRGAELALLIAILTACAEATPLVLTSDPAGATVTLNDQDVGVTPVTLTIADTFVGAARVEFIHEGYVPLVVEVVISPGQQITLKGVLTSLQHLVSAPTGGGPTDLGPSQVSSQVQEQVRQAVVRFRADCGAWPAVLSDVCARGPESLSRLFNSAGETIIAGGYRGPYLDSLPIDPSTGGVDWLYDSATGEVVSRGTRPADATMPPATLGSGAITLAEWVGLLVQAAGIVAQGEAPAPSIRPGPAVDGGAPGLSRPGVVDPSPAGPALDWRPIGG